MSPSGAGRWTAVAALALLLLVPMPPTRADATPGTDDGYTLSLVSPPNFNALAPYVYNYHGSAYPALDFAGKYAGDLIYIDTSDRMDWFDPNNGSSGDISGPLTLLYQTTPANSGPEDQLDNEFLLDTPSPVALLIGNLTTSPGPLTVETVDLANGTISLVTTPVEFENDVQADYNGDGTVVVFNATNIGGEPTYFVNMYNHTSWYAGLNIGIAANNIYWIPALRSFVDVQGIMVTQYSVDGTSIAQAGRVWFNNSAVHSITGVNGAVYDAATGKIAFWDATNAGWYYLVVGSSGGRITPAGSYAYFSNEIIYTERYCYTSPYVWSVDSPAPSLVGPTQLFSPFNNSTEPAPNVLGRQYGSGGNSNFLFENPNSTASILSLNASLVDRDSLRSGSFVWATTAPPPVPPTNSTGSVGSSIPWDGTVWWYGGSIAACWGGGTLAFVWWKRHPRPDPPR